MSCIFAKLVEFIILISITLSTSLPGGLNNNIKMAKNIAEKTGVPKQQIVDNVDKPRENDEKIEKFQEAEIKYNEIDKTLLGKIQYQVFKNGELVKNFKRDKPIIMGYGEKYSDIDGVTCFRGNNYRDSGSFGSVEVRENKLEVAWSNPIGAMDNWSGVGWNGQGAVVKWPEDMKMRMNIKPDKKNKKELKEVIYAALDGKVYFFDLEDGKYTRNPIQIPGPVKGSLSIDPRGIPLLYVGQGINKVGGKTVEMGYRIYSLIDQSRLYFINGKDSVAYRSWQAFDSTAIIDKNTDTMLLGGENGLFYTLKLNTNYDKTNNTIRVNPEVIKYRYKISGNSYQGIENSVAVYRNLAYFVDNGGYIQCINLSTMSPVWVQNVTDDTDSTAVIDEENGGAALYTACEVDKQGSKGFSYIRKIDALSGRIIWERKYSCESLLGESPVNGGALGTPIVGKNKIKDMIIYNLARCGGFNKGKLIALEKASGKEIWSLSLDNYSWSSPVAVYDKRGVGYIILCDSAGWMYLIEGSSGKVLNKVSLGANVEGSPVVYDDLIVVGTRGQKIFGVRIK